MARWSIHWGQCSQRSFSQMPFNFSRDGYSVSWCVIYVCFQQRHLCLQLHCYPWGPCLWEVPVTSQLTVPLQGPGIVAISPSPCTFLPQNFTQTFVCWVSVVLLSMGEFTPFLLHSVISGVPGGSRTKHVFWIRDVTVMVTWVAMSLWLTSTAGWEEVPEGPGRNRSPRALMQGFSLLG